MISYPTIEQHAKSSCDIDSPSPPRKDVCCEDQSFHKLATANRKNGLDESKPQVQDPEKRVTKDETTGGEISAIGENGPPSEVLRPTKFLQFIQIPFAAPRLTANALPQVSEFVNDVPQVSALAELEPQLDASLSKVKITGDLPGLLADAGSDTHQLKRLTREELSQLPPTDPASTPAAHENRLVTAIAEHELIREVRLEPSGNDLGRLVTQRVTETLIHEIPLIEAEGAKRITLKLHPAELGKLTLHVDWHNETVKARIVASEMATTEMLNREKNHLLDTMHAHGLKFESLDVSYEGSTRHRNGWPADRKTRVAGGREPETVPVEQTMRLRTRSNHGSVVDIIV
jgi:hypothetical protein